MDTVGPVETPCFCLPCRREARWRPVIAFWSTADLDHSVPPVLKPTGIVVCDDHALTFNPSLYEELLWDWLCEDGRRGYPDMRTLYVKMDRLPGTVGEEPRITHANIFRGSRV